MSGMLAIVGNILQHSSSIYSRLKRLTSLKRCWDDKNNCKLLNRNLRSFSVKHDIKEYTDVKIWALHHLLALALWAYSVVFVWPVELTRQLYSIVLHVVVDVWLQVLI